MAQRRMFNMKIVDTDAFIDMPQSTQNLYFHLGMRADDEGFVGNINRIMKMLGSSEDDKRVLIGKRFIIEFESGVIVIKHWKMNNYLQNDRIQETNYLQEKGLLYVKENGAYTLDKEQGKPLIDGVYTKCIHRVVESSIVESSIDIDKEIIESVPAVSTASPKHKFGNYKNVLLTEEEFAKLLAKENGNEAIEYLSEYIELKGYKAKSHYLAILKWVFTAIKEKTLKENEIKARENRLNGKEQKSIDPYANQKKNY